MVELWMEVCDLGHLCTMLDYSGCKPWWLNHWCDYLVCDWYWILQVDSATPEPTWEEWWNMALNTGPADIYVGLALSTGPVWTSMSSTGPVWTYDYWPCGHLRRFCLKYWPLWTSMSNTFLRYDFSVFLLFFVLVECSQYYYNFTVSRIFPSKYCL
jgi:hypothetical protein